MEKQHVYQAAIIGGFFAALTDSLPFLNLINCFCCLGITLGGALAVRYLRQHANQAEFSRAELVHVGLLTGIFGAFASFFLNYLMFLLWGNWQIQWITNMMDKLDELPPLWEKLYEEIQKEEYQGFTGFAIFIRAMLLFPVFTTIGALIGHRIFSRTPR